MEWIFGFSAEPFGAMKRPELSYFLWFASDWLNIFEMLKKIVNSVIKLFSSHQIFQNEENSHLSCSGQIEMTQQKKNMAWAPILPLEDG